jgi:hypothetical protein
MTSRHDLPTIGKRSVHASSCRGPHCELVADELTRAGPAIVEDAWSKLEDSAVKNKTTATAQPSASNVHPAPSTPPSAAARHSSDESNQHTVTTPPRPSDPLNDPVINTQLDHKVSPERADQPSHPPATSVVPEQPSSLQPAGDLNSLKLPAESQTENLALDSQDKLQSFSAQPTDSLTSIPAAFASPGLRARTHSACFTSPAPTATPALVMPSPSMFAAALPPLHPVYSAPSPRVRDTSSAGSGSGSMGSVTFPPLEAPLLSGTNAPSATEFVGSVGAGAAVEAHLSPKSPAGVSMLGVAKSDEKKDHKQSPDAKKPSDATSSAAGASAASAGPKVTPTRMFGRRSSMSKFGDEKSLVVVGTPGSERRASLFEDEEDQVLQAPSPSPLVCVCCVTSPSAAF